MKVLTYFLPQFHSCEFNNRWWFEGFTEWDNVKAAKPLFSNHSQPKVPVDGYFDLLDSDELVRQYQQAQKSGIDGFVFYHYWYEGKMPLSKPLNQLLSNPDHNVPFSLCWANHSWTRSWKNRKGSLDTLIEQTYETEDERSTQFEYLAKVFNDSRYIEVDGKPIFQIYIPEDIPELANYIGSLRAYMKSEIGKELHLIASVRSNRMSFDYLNCFDSIVFSQPLVAFYSTEDIFNKKTVKKLSPKFYLGVVRSLPLPIKKILYFFQDKYFNNHSVYDFDTIWKTVITQYKNAVKSNFKVQPSAFVGFDNTARYGARAKVVEGFTPAKFEKNLLELIKLGAEGEAELLFINAWNEWGEGMYLQADEEFGYDKLKAVSNAISNFHR